jgi:hypothetical protein
MHQMLINNFAEFIATTDNFDLCYGFTIFRGQTIAANLVPGIARKDNSIDTTEQEKKYWSSYV